MKLLRYGEKGAERPALLDGGGTIRDLGGHIDDINPAALAPDSLNRLRDIDPASLPPVEGNPRIGACIAGVGKFMCIGVNYSDHAKETGSKVPDHPILFMKATSAISGPNDMVMMPRGSTHTDWEVELGVAIGKPCKYAAPQDALDYVAGYFLANDVSERRFQKELSGQWTKGKSCDTYGPIGPWLVTPDEIPDVQNLGMSLDVNGERMQTGNTSTMIYGVAECISHMSQLMTLHPGDVIITGTPPGVGLGMKPPRFLKVGDVMELRIDGLGEQRQEVGEDK